MQPLQVNPSLNIEDRRGEAPPLGVLMRQLMGVPIPEAQVPSYPDYGPIGRLGIEAGYFDIKNPFEYPPVYEEPLQQQDGTKPLLPGGSTPTPSDVWNFDNLTRKTPGANQ